MFPNVRLMVVAILAAIAGIGCGLGLFATFRVNHEPLARLAEGSPPLRLAFDNLTLNAQIPAPLDARLPLNGAANAIPVPAISTPGPPDAADAAASGDAENQPATANAPDMDRNGAVTVAAVAPSEQTSTSRSDSPGELTREAAAAALGNQEPTAPLSAPAAPPARAEQMAALKAAPPDEGPSAPLSEPGASGLAAPRAEQMVNATAADERPTVPPNEPTSSRPAGSSADQTAALNAADERPSAPPNEPAASIPAVPSTEQTAVVNPSAAGQQPAVRPAKPVAEKAAKPAAKAAHPAPVRRAARLAHIRRTVPTAATQPTYQYSQTSYAQPTYAQSTYAQPTYSWANGTTQASQPVKRVQIKRHRTAKKTVPAAQSNSLPTTAGLGGQ